MVVRTVKQKLSRSIFSASEIWPFYKDLDEIGGLAIGVAAVANEEGLLGRNLVDTMIITKDLLLHKEVAVVLTFDEPEIKQ